MSLGIGACVSIVFVTFVYVGPVSRFPVVAETLLRLNIFSPVVTIAVFPCALERVVVGAVEVDPYCTALTPGHQISRTFPNLGRCHRRCWRCAGLRVGGSSRWVLSPRRRLVVQELGIASVPFNQTGAVAVLAI